MIDNIFGLIKAHPDCEGYLNGLLGELKGSTGYDAGSITDVLEAFRKSGIAYMSDEPGKPGETGGGSAGTGIGGVPSVSFSQGGTPDQTYITALGEILHWAGMPRQGSGYANYFTDTVRHDWGENWNRDVMKLCTKEPSDNRWTFSIKCTGCTVGTCG